MFVSKENINEFLKKDTQNISENEVYTVALDTVLDAGLNPREIDPKYAEQIPITAPPVQLGIIDNDVDLKDKLIIIDGNHRIYSLLNVHGVNKCYAKIKRYNNRGEAVIDAYKFNISHGRRLTDKEISIGIKKTIIYLKDKDTYNKLAEMLNISKSSMYEYLVWDKVEKILNSNIDKIKANKLYFLLKEDDGENKLKSFYSLNKNLSIRKLNDAVKYYKKYKKIINFEKILVEKALLEDDDEALSLQDKSISTLKNNSSLEKLEQLETVNNLDDINLEEDKASEMINGDTIEENDSLNNYEYDDTLQEEIEEENNEKPYVFNPNQEFEEGGKIQIISKELKEQTKQDNNNNKLVSKKGLNRLYSFDNVMSNIFKDLLEGIINSKSILEETLNRSLHNNRKEFEIHKQEYLSVLKNCNSILEKMDKMIKKANKDFK